jgi:serpin B
MERKQPPPHPSPACGGGRSLWHEAFAPSRAFAIACAARSVRSLPRLRGRVREGAVDSRSIYLAIFKQIVAVSALALLATTARAAEDDARIKQLTASYRASGQELFARFAQAPGNIVFSPYSIGTAMAMALAGARGNTEAEMLRVLKHTLARPEIDAANGALMKLLNGYDRSAAPPECFEGMRWTGQRCESRPAADGRCPGFAQRKGQVCAADPLARTPSAKLAVANALMLVGDEKLAPEYIALVREKYGGEVFAHAGLADINKWVRGKTEGKIPQILDSLDPKTVAVLLNAVYFKARWQQVFPKEFTKDAPFNLAASRRVDVPTMHTTANFAVAARAGYRAILLPYDVPALGMIVVVPGALDGLAEVERRLDAAEFSALSATLAAREHRQYVDLALPRFKITFAADLKAVFQQAGLHEPFGDRADFTGMTGRPAAERPVKIDFILHRAVIDVTEEGTEAAAVTAVGIGPASLPPPPVPFAVDRPFLFYLVDNASGAVLFAGRTMDPREGK